MSNPSSSAAKRTAKDTAESVPRRTTGMPTRRDPMHTLEYLDPYTNEAKKTKYTKGEEFGEAFYKRQAAKVELKKSAAKVAADPDSMLLVEAFLSDVPAPKGIELKVVDLAAIALGHGAYRKRDESGLNVFVTPDGHVFVLSELHTDPAISALFEHIEDSMNTMQVTSAEIRRLGGASDGDDHEDLRNEFDEACDDAVTAIDAVLKCDFIVMPDEFVRADYDEDTDGLVEALQEVYAALERVADGASSAEVMQLDLFADVFDEDEGHITRQLPNSGDDDDDDDDDMNVIPDDAELQQALGHAAPSIGIIDDEWWARVVNDFPDPPASEIGINLPAAMPALSPFVSMPLSPCLSDVSQDTIVW